MSTRDPTSRDDFDSEPPGPELEAAEYARMRAYVRHLTYVEFPGASHSMTAEIPDACARAYAEFLAKAED